MLKFYNNLLIYFIINVPLKKLLIYHFRRYSKITCMKNKKKINQKINYFSIYLLKLFFLKFTIIPLRYSLNIKY